jgi:3-hydroxyacyl-[acyl-carrier-protein] dehydratase
MEAFMDKQIILKLLPHRYPFLFVDDILEVEYKKRVIGIKNISMNEPWTQGHFENDPIFPGVLIIETMAQIGGFVFYNEKNTQNSLAAYLSRVDKAKFLKKVVPGQTIFVEGIYESSISNLARVKVNARVDGKKVAEAVVTYYFR